MARKAAEPLFLNRKSASSLRLSVPGSQVACAVDHGGTNPRVGFFDTKGRAALIGPGGRSLPEGVHIDFPTYQSMPRDCGSAAELPQYSANMLQRSLGPLLRRWGVSRLGYAMAGPVTAQGVQVKAPQIWGPTVTDVPYRGMLERALCLEGRVLLGNDMWAAASDIIGRGRRQKPPMDIESFVVITVSSGIGSKVVTNGQVQLGVEGLAGEIGHMPVLWPTDIIPGRRCGCGGLYCLEAGSSGNANAFRAKAEADRLAPLAASSPSRGLIEAIGGVSLQPGPDRDERAKRVNQAVVRAAKRGDLLATSIVRASIRPLARAVAALENQLNTRNFYFVGGFALALGEDLLRYLREDLGDVGIIGRSAADIAQMGRLYNVKAQDWGLRGAAMAAHQALPE